MSVIKLKMWNEDKIVELIKLYKQYPLLWDPKHIDYKNRQKKNDALRNLSQILDIDIIEVERKINVLMAQYRKNRKRVHDLKKAGMGSDEIGYNVWYGYKLLMFLEDRYYSPRSKSTWEQEENIETPEENDVREEGETFLATALQDGVTCTAEEYNALLEFEQNVSNTPSSRKRQIFPTNKSVQERTKKIKDGDLRINESFSIRNDPLDHLGSKDEYTLYGEQIALKLKKFDEITRVETQHKINCIIYEAEMKILQQGTSFGTVKNNN